MHEISLLSFSLKKQPTLKVESDNGIQRAREKKATAECRGQMISINQLTTQREQARAIATSTRIRTSRD
ncbi:hypothetical protein A3739_09220 [Oleiphilus sp. HI0067]|nr:hypothetical protein A3739_09220 [Oleiphilus sp. HI0067]